MTPKQKAEDLFYRCPIVELGDDKGIVQNDLSINALKEVLIFLVNEIIKSKQLYYLFTKEEIDSMYMTTDDRWIYERFNTYWKKVKKEIEKL